MPTVCQQLLSIGMRIGFDLEKAYDTTWKYGILRDLHDAIDFVVVCLNS